MSAAAIPTAKSLTDRGRTTIWYEASARTRVRLLLDPGSFLEFIGPEMREVSPHLRVFDLPEQFDDGIVVGRGSVGGSPVFVAAQEGRFMGGAFGEVHGAKLTGLLRAAREIGSVPVLILFDTGGVRLQEANAGELAIAEIMRAVVEARTAGVKVIGSDRRPFRMLWRRRPDRRLLFGTGGIRAGPDRRVRSRGDRDQSWRRGIRLA
jgi:malonate decarboxylase beta subunit